MSSGSIVANAQSKVVTESYYFKKEINGSLDEVKARLGEVLKTEQFGIVTEINLHEKFKEKLNVDYPAYTILGVCNPKLAYDAIKLEENVGVFLPCKVLLKGKPGNIIEVIVLNPETPMGMLENKELSKVAIDVSESLKRVIEAL